MKLALVNHSSHVTAHEASAIVTAVHTQLRRDVAPAWERALPSLAFYASPAAAARAHHLPAAHLPADARLIILADNDTTPGALGYHDENGDRPYAVILVPTILGAGGKVLAGELSVASVVSHEAIEMFGDPDVDAWADYPPGGETAAEWCDAVQGDSYELDVAGVAVSVSNFLLPAWFDAQATHGPFDRLSKLEAPFTMSPGGYLIVRKTGGTTQIEGDRPAWRARSRRHARRGVT